MDFTAIIAEFNPFTLGHEYIIKKAKEMFPTSSILVIMSGDFVQRGTPSIMDKFTRAKHASLSGADLVIELPVVYSISSAQDFAFGAVSILNQIPAVKRLVFGSECGNITKIKECANQILNSKIDIKESLKEGNSYASSLIDKLPLLNTPNNLLGVMYTKALIKLNSLIKPITIKRENNYNSTLLSGLPSASAIRKLKEENKLDFTGLVPTYVNSSLINAPKVDYDKLYSIISYKLLTSDEKELQLINGINEGIENKITRENIKATTYEELASLVTSKRYFKNKVQRILTSIMLNIKKRDVFLLNEYPYIKVLNINQNLKSAILKELNKSTIPVIIKKQDIDGLSENYKHLIEKDILASNIYSIITSTYKNKDFKNKL